MILATICNLPLITHHLLHTCWCLAPATQQVAECSMQDHIREELNFPRDVFG
jgi:hypothetical protein